MAKNTSTTDLTPVPKVQAALAAGGFVTLLTWLANVTLGVEIPAEVGQALVVIISFIAAYFTGDK